MLLPSRHHVKGVFAKLWGGFPQFFGRRFGLYAENGRKNGHTGSRMPTKAARKPDAWRISTLAKAGQKAGCGGEQGRGRAESWMRRGRQDAAGEQERGWRR
jgi:hypothetical protein